MDYGQAMWVWELYTIHGESKAAIHILMPDRPVRRWLHRLRAIPLMPPDYVRVVWNDCLTNPPWTHDPVVDGNLRSFRDYFKNTWLPNREKLDLCNHWDTERTRTTNHAEGYHNGLS